ncbi:sensor histidine kinase [Streptomyces sp. NPDC006134]|uniref:sensor histidine kinase n=1 Tax=Streptomyces sp. NPDC006134 TaxID=3154467 RepID=UPI00340DC98D
MHRPDVWWWGKSTPAKVETYTRWSLYSFALVEVGWLGPMTFTHLPFPFAVGLLAALCGHAALGAVTAARSLDWTRGRRDQPVRLVTAYGVITAVLAVGSLALLMRVPGDNSGNSTAVVLFVGVLMVGAGNVTLGLRSRRRVIASVFSAAIGAGTASLPVGLPGLPALITGLTVLFATGVFALTASFSVWMLDAVYELDEARETRARLAVAEERLRFGRDLHDVMGRNLAVIALKSELAVQLAQRGRPEAVEQMIEAQRLAQEAQREVREVVRGYRQADLGAELAGAQGVLAAAGIDCTITGSADGLPAPVQSALGWVVREAATNVLRHGDARRCTVGLEVTEGRVVLSVENDGVSETAAGTRTGSGLAGLRERLAGIDGTLRAGPDGQGCFRLTAEIPLPPAAESPSSSPSSVPSSSVPSSSVPSSSVPSSSVSPSSVSRPVNEVTA